MKLRTFIIAATASFSLAGCSNSAATDKPFNPALSLENNIDQALIPLIEEAGPGAIIKVARGNEILFEKSYGLAELESKLSHSPTTSFYLASVSKQFTAMAVMILRERGALDYQDTIGQHFPEAPDYWQSVSIHHLLTHQSGIPDYYEPLGDQTVGIDNDGVFKWAITLKAQNFEAGTQVEYSNTGYIILALLVERVSGLPIEDFMRENIFAPSRMDQTSVYNEDTARKSVRAIGYNSDLEVDDFDAFTVGAGGIYSTADDLLKWSHAIDNGSLISTNAFQIATQRHVDEFGGGYGYGYGWVLSEKEGHKILIHTGGYGGFYTLISKIPATDLTIIILANDGKFWPLPLHDEIVDYLYKDSKTEQ